MKKQLLLFITLSLFALKALGQATGTVLSDYPTGGSIGSAATTVDVASIFNINQTTAGQTITVPNPTNTGLGKNLRIRNIGSTPFTLTPGGTVNPSTYGVELDWTGSTYAIMANGSTGGGGGGVTSFNTRTGAVTLSSLDVTTALTYTPMPRSAGNDVGITSNVAGPIAEYFARRTSGLSGPNWNNLRTYDLGAGSYSNPDSYAQFTQNPNGNYLRTKTTSSVTELIMNASTPSITLQVGGAGAYVGVSTGSFYAQLKTTNLTSDVAIEMPSSPGTLSLSPTISADATDADFTAVVNSIKLLPVSTLTANRNITIPAGVSGNTIDLYNNEAAFSWNLIGVPVYLDDRTTVVTQLLYNFPTYIKFISGKWIITN
jgi:hypothetical protein